MRATGLIEELQRRRFDVPYGQGQLFEGYEQKLKRWGCSQCRFYEKRVFKSGLASTELDAYIICRFDGEPVDLIEEATVCPKNGGPKQNENQKSDEADGRDCKRAA